jgi:hypothetical protein
MRDVDREMEAVEKAMAAEDVTVEIQVKSDLWRILQSILPWAVIAAAVLVVFRMFGA